MGAQTKGETLLDFRAGVPFGICALGDVCVPVERFLFRQSLVASLSFVATIILLLGAESFAVASSKIESVVCSADVRSGSGRSTESDVTTRRRVLCSMIESMCK